MNLRVLYGAQYHGQHCTLQAFEHFENCICATTMTNIRPDRDPNLVPPGYKPQSIRMSHRGRRACGDKSYNLYTHDTRAYKCLVYCTPQTQHHEILLTAEINPLVLGRSGKYFAFDSPDMCLAPLSLRAL